jgi:hypothetical protein
MSEKHLTEQPWKLLATKNQIKDNGFQKALVSYGKLERSKDPAKAAEFLSDLSELALKLKKANATIKEVTTYLDEVVKEANKTRQAIAALPKPEGREKEEEEEEGADIKARLVNAMKKVKAMQGGEPIGFVACVAKPFYGVLLAKSASERIGTPHKKTLTELTGGTKFFLGDCVFENEAHTFIVESVPAGLAKNLKKSLKEFTGLAYKLRVRDIAGAVIADGDTEVADEEAGVPETSASGIPGSPPTLPTAADQAPVAEAIPKRTEKPVVSPSQAPPSSPKAVPTQAKAQPAAGAREIKLSTYLTGRANLRTARENSAKALQSLQQAILAKAAGEPFYAEVEAKSQKLFEFLTPIDDEVVNKLDEAGKCLDPELQLELNNKVRELIQKQLAGIRNHPLAGFVEKNPFGKFAIKQPLEVTLAALDKQLS